MSFPAPDRNQSLNLVDLAALVGGYALAGLLVRAFWPESRQVSGPVALVLVVVYGWLGLAMAGPILLLLRRLHSTGNGKWSWSEIAWVVVGFYWIGLLILVLPARLPVDPILGILPILAALALRWLSPMPRSTRAGQRPAWTHHAALALIWSWPIAWGGLILLGKTLF